MQTYPKVQSPPGGLLFRQESANTLWGSLSPNSQLVGLPQINVARWGLYKTRVARAIAEKKVIGGGETQDLKEPKLGNQ